MNIAIGWIVVLDCGKGRHERKDQHETLSRKLRGESVYGKCVTTDACFWYPNWYPNWYPKIHKEERTYILSNVSP